MDLVHGEDGLLIVVFALLLVFLKNLPQVVDAHILSHFLTLLSSDRLLQADALALLFLNCISLGVPLDDFNA